MCDPARRVHPITVQNRVSSASADAHGHVDKTAAASWQTYLTARAEIMTRGGREYYRADILNAETTHVFRIPYSAAAAAILPDMRVIHDSLTYGITAAYDVDGLHAIIQIETKRNDRERIAG